MAYDNIISRTDAAALIPETVSSDLLTNLANNSVALNVFRKIRMGSAQTRMPVISALPTAYFVNGDTGLKQTTEVNWDNKYLNVEELATIVPIPEAVMDDTNFDVWGTVRPLIEQAIGRALDAAVFFGTNKPASWPTAIVTAAVAAGNVVARGTNAAATGGIAGDISDLFATLEADGFNPDAVVSNTTTRGRLRQARASTGEQLAEVTGMVNMDQVFGVPVTYPMAGQWPTGLSAAEMVAMQRDNFILGLRQDFTYKVLDQAVIQDGAGAIQFNLAQQDMVALRVVFRVAFQVANVLNYQQAVAANRYPAAVLRSPAA